MNILPTRNYTIGFLTPNMNQGNGLLLWQGIQGQAQAQGVRLVTFAGGDLRHPEPFYYQANQVYELVDRQHLDGLIIWTSSLAAFVGAQGVINFCQHYSPMPVVGIGIPLPGIPSIHVDSYNGMREAVLHLVQVHGKRRMVFICGPERHYEAQERLRAYRDVIEEFNLDADPDLVSPPCRWIEQDATQAMRLLVEERHVQFDSVVAVNDQLAYGAMVYLREKGVRLPEDVAIVGFDNNPIGSVCTPPLTTVPNRIRQRGRQVVDLLLAKINGEEVPERTILPTSLKIRQSCGCQDPYIVQVSRPAALAMQLADLRSSILSHLRHTVTEEKEPDWPEKLLDAFEASLDNKSAATFLTTLQRLLQSSATVSLELREWQAALSELRHWVIPLEQYHPERLEFAERFLHQGRVMIGEFAARSQAYREWQHNRQLENLHQLRLKISAAETLASLMDILADDLPQLGIASGCLALYLDSEHPLEGIRLVLAFNKRGRLPEIEERVFTPSTRLIPPTLLDLPEPFNLVVHPLNFGTEQLGFLVVDPGTFESSSHQVLREQISSALKAVLLIEQNVQLYLQTRQNQQIAEEANLLKSRFLSMVSHELLTPLVLLVGLSEMMLREGIGNRPPLPEFYRQDLTRIHASAQQLGSLVRDVLDLARSQLGKLTLTNKPIHLNEVLKPVLLVGEQMAHSKGLDWQVDIPDHLPPVMGDASRLQQVTLNLVNNAVKFTDRGSVKLEVSLGEGQVKVAITDTGLSVPLAEQEAIFDEFRQSDRTVARGYGGLGIGLAICRQIIELHGGKIGVHSSGQENSGSTFYFSLPILTGSILAQPVESSQVVLILTEQMDRSTPLQQHLERQGFQVRTLDIHKNPQWLEELMADPQGALVLDLPSVESGWGIIEILKSHSATQDIPVIFYSLLQENDSGSMLALDYLTKPIAANNLAHVLQRYGITPKCSDQRKVLIVDDDPEILALNTRLVEEHLPACRVFHASNGYEALEFMRVTPPDLVLLDLLMPELDGMAVLKTMQENKRLKGIPVIVLTAQRLSQDEMAHLNQGVAAVLAKGVFTAQETLVHIEQALTRHKHLGSETQRLLRKAMVYIQEHYTQSITRKQLACYIGISERHLNRCFLQETGVTPLTYLNRYRIQQAKGLLEQGELSITEVMGRVGFSESSYFTRLFRREVGVSPSVYKKGQRS